MEYYNFWADLLDTFQSSPNAIKVVWLLIPPAFLLGLVALAMHFHLAAKRVKRLKRVAKNGFMRRALGYSFVHVVIPKPLCTFGRQALANGRLVYTVVCDHEDRIRVYRHSDKSLDGQPFPSVEADHAPAFVSLPSRSAGV